MSSHNQPITNKRKVDVWKISTITLAVVVVFLLVSPTIQKKLIEKEYKENLVDQLILNNIIFVYSSNCGACHKQIEIFGEDWEKYIQSGLTLDCATHSSEICMQIKATPSWVQSNGTDYKLVGEGVVGIQ